MRSNDILSNEKQIGMTSPTVRFDNGMYCVGGQITFGVDFNKVEACLSFSKSKWIDKGGVTSIRDWIQPIDAIKTLSIKDFIATLKQTFEDKFKIKLIEEKVGN
jgi:lipoate-protein ligase A